MNFLIPRDRFRFRTNETLEEVKEKIKQLMGDGEYYGTQSDKRFVIAPVRKAMMSSSLVVRGFYTETEEGTDIQIIAQPGGVEYLGIVVDVFIIWQLFQNLMSMNTEGIVACIAGLSMVQIYLHTCFWRPEKKAKAKLKEVLECEPEQIKGKINEIADNSK